MQTKLTLTIDKDTIRRAKYFAKKSNRSLSEIIQSYLERITQNNDIERDPELEKIKGIINLPENFDDKTTIREILAKKHGI